MSKRVIAFVVAGLFSAGTLAGCSQLLGIEELSPGGPIDAMPADPDAGSPGLTCTIDNGGCDPNADCYDTPEGRICECRQGFVGDGLTCIMPWELVTTVPDLSFYNGFGAFAIGSGTRLYFFPESNDPPPSSFFASYDLLSGDLRGEPLPPDPSDFCACGLTQVLVALDDYLYQFGNYGMRYHTVLQTWEPVTYPAENERGEAAAAAVGRRIYTFGGRSNARSVQYFDVDANLWTDLGATMPWDLDYGTAIAVEPNLIYVFGGRVDGVPDRAAVYDVEANAWEALPDIPGGLGSHHGAGAASGRMFMVSFDMMYLFDPNALTWSIIPLPPVAYGYAATVGGEIYLVGGLDGQTEIHRFVGDGMIQPGPGM